MYIPSHFSVPDLAALHGLITEHPFGMLVTAGSDGLDANHLPFEFDPAVGEHGLLRGHVARQNPVWQNVADGDEVMVVFRADHAYISPTWYPSKQDNPGQVPTWNYRVVHAHGRIRIRDDERHVRGLVARLTRTHESGMPAPWKMGDAPPDFIDRLLKAIVGIDIELTCLVGKFKLSQNRLAVDRDGAAQALIDRGEAEIGAAMRSASGNPPLP